MHTGKLKYMYFTPAATYRDTGQRWILDGGLRGGDPSRSPFWRTPEESCKGLGSVSFENKHSTRGKSGKKRKKRQHPQIVVIIG